MPKRGHEPVRTCVACRAESGKRDLVRLVRGPGGEIALDPGGRSSGRGAYLHGEQACIELARRRRALERALRASAPEALWTELTARAAGAAD